MTPLYFLHVDTNNVVKAYLCKHHYLIKLKQGVEVKVPIRLFLNEYIPVNLLF